MGADEFLGYLRVPKMSLIKKTTNRMLKVHGPHNIDICSFLFGSLLGGSRAEMRCGRTRIILQQEESNVTYLFWFHQYLAQRGYCSYKKPKLGVRIGTRGKKRFFFRVRTYSYASFNWIYDAFYPHKQKVVPKDLCWILLTPLALTIWIMSEGIPVSTGVKISTNCFQEDEVLFLCEVLNKKYNFYARPIREKYQFIIYIPKAGMSQLGHCISKYLVPSMHRKLNGYYFV